jgi:hypothetical protein
LHYDNEAEGYSKPSRSTDSYPSQPSPYRGGKKVGVICRLLLWPTRIRHFQHLLYHRRPKRSHNIKERWNGLAVFEHQPTFAANKRGTHLAGKMLHPIKDGFPFASLGELCSRVGEGDRNEL